MTVESGPPLGIMPMEYPSVSLQLRQGDRVIFLTDGVFDAKNRAGERIGFDPVADFSRQHAEDPQLVSKVVEYVDDFSKGMERADDLTMVEIWWNA